MRLLKWEELSEQMKNDYVSKFQNTRMIPEEILKSYVEIEGLVAYTTSSTLSKKDCENKIIEYAKRLAICKWWQFEEKNHCVKEIREWTLELLSKD